LGKLWFDWIKRQLLQSKVEQALQMIREALRLKDLSDSARNTLKNLTSYLETHRKHMDYLQFRELGLPIGSGMVESACKWLIQQRFKGVGMRWSEEGFNHLLELRLAWVNGRVDQLFNCKEAPKL